MGYAEQDTAAGDPGLNVQVRQALIQLCLEVIAEDAFTVPNHLNRYTYCIVLLRSGITSDTLRCWMLACCSDPTFVSPQLDADVYTRVSSCLNSIAGIL